MAGQYWSLHEACWVRYDPEERRADVPEQAQPPVAATLPEQRPDAEQEAPATP